MNEQETFLERWARLKREGTGETQSKPAEVQHLQEPELPRAPITSEPAAEAASSLPDVGSITAESDVRLFLQSGVPTDLVRSALRAAWATDPAIRDFVGIAESQWDFNDPTAMPGFGPLTETQSAQSVVRHSVPPVNSAPDAVERKAEIVNPGRDGQVDDVWLSSGMENKNRAREDVTTTQAIHPHHDNTDSASRRHGSALPK